jgi:transcriptional regulator with XRE-family HTH domain
VDETLYTEDLDLTPVATREELVALLRTIRLRADKPSLRALEARTRLSTVPLSKTVLSEMLNGVRFPRKAVMLAFLQACGVQDDHLEPWRRAWERIAVREQGEVQARPSAGAPARHVTDIADGIQQGSREARKVGGQLSTQISGSEAQDSLSATMADEGRQRSDQMVRLREENERLRLELAASSGVSAGQPSRPGDQAGEREAAGPAVRRRELGVLLHDLRLEHDMTVEQVAERLLCSPSKVSRMESGFRSGTVRDVRDLGDLYGIPDQQRDHLMRLARESKQQGWWHTYNQNRFGEFVGLENGAASMKVYEAAIIPGLLQTEAYARAMHHAGSDELSSRRIEELIEVRMTRQRILTRSNPPRYWSIIDEAALRRSVGGPNVMRGQLERIIEVSELPNVTLGVIPFAAGAHPAMGNKFVILEFAEPVPGMVYEEGLAGWIYIESPPDVRRYQRVFEFLLTIALDGEKSGRFITKMISASK